MMKESKSFINKRKHCQKKNDKMKAIIQKLTTSLFALALTFPAFAQYSKPYRIAYNPVNKAYYISNFGTQSITKVDSFYKTSSAITGFTKIRDIDVIALDTMAVLIVVDDNDLKIFNASSLQKIVEFDIPNVTDVHDFVMDAEGKFFYLSDHLGNKIIKGQFGAAPFFTPSFSTYISNVSRPCGMMINNDSALVFVSDDTMAKIYIANLKTGGYSTAMKTGLDSLNAITQDMEGNYFVTNWGDSYLYIIDQDFISKTKLTSYYKPAGMYINRSNDLFLIVCHLCNKLEFDKLHYFEPVGQIYACQGDSITVDLDIGINGIGTYLANNVFSLELSDTNGSFDNPVVIGSVKTTVKPKYIKGVLPFGLYSSNSKFRIRSSHPDFASSSWSVTALEAPDPSEYIIGDTFACVDEVLWLGKKAFSGVSVWKPGGNLSSTSSTLSQFSSTMSGSYQYELSLTDGSSGCVSTKKVVVAVADSIKKDWVKSYTTCYDENLVLQLGDSNLIYDWTPKVRLDDYASVAPFYLAKLSTTYQVKIKREHGECADVDTIRTKVHAQIPKDLPSDSFSLCQKDTFQMVKSMDNRYSYSLSNGMFEQNESILFHHNRLWRHVVSLDKINKETKCELKDSVILSVTPIPTYDGLKVNYVAKKVTIDLNISDSIDVFVRVINICSDSSIHLFDGYNNGDFPLSFTFYEPCGLIVFYFRNWYSVCDYMLDSVEFNESSAIQNQSFQNTITVYPNPSSTQVFVDLPEGNIESIELLDQTGRVIIQAKQSNILDVSGLQPMIYMLKIMDEGNNVGYKKIVVAR
ncbi:MAG: DNA-binding beta-propeller fold protein YncE [Bacteroidia bacterium]